MDAFALGLIVLLGLGLMYAFINVRLTKQIESRFQETYKTQLTRDIQEFYREMESYAALVESRINRYKVLVEKHESILQRWGEIASELKKSKKTKDISLLIERSLEKEQKIFEALEQVKHSIPAIIPKAPDKKIPQPTAKTADNPQVAPQSVRETKKTVQPPITQATDFDYALSLIYEYDEPAPTPSKHISTIEVTDEYRVQEGFLSRFGKVMTQLLLNRPSKDPQPSFSDLVQAKAHTQPPRTNKPVTLSTYEPPKQGVGFSTLPNSPLAKKIDPQELQLLVEKIQTQPAQRPVLLKTLLMHQMPLAMISDLTGIELSQLEAIRKIYQL